MVALNVVICTMDTILQTVNHDFKTRNHGGRIQETYVGRDDLVLINYRIWTFLAEYGILRVLICSEVDRIQRLRALTCSNKVSFDM